MPAKSTLTDEQRIAELQRVAAELGQETCPERSSAERRSSVPWLIARRFGTWNTAATAASLRPARQAKIMRSRITEDDLLRNLRQVHQKVGRVATVNVLERPGTLLNGAVPITTGGSRNGY
jgi:hypothetical protein